MKNILSLLSILLLAGCAARDKEDEATSHAISSPILAERWRIVNAHIDSIREGDLLMRCGNDQTSATLRDFSQQDKSFSHSGIALKIDGGIYVYHNMAGNLNPDEIMRRDRVDSFLTPENNIAFGIFRYDMNPEEIARMKEIVLEHYQNKLQFDMNFDLETDHKMYCVEMIAKSISKATNGRIRFPLSMVNDELRRKYTKMALRNKVIPSPRAANQRQYLALDNLYLNPYCKEVVRVEFESNTGPIMIPSPEIDSN